MNKSSIADQLNISKTWAMPNKNTFSIPPIAKMLREEMAGTGDVWIDPFANTSRIAKITNDLNPEYGTDHSMDALDFLKMFSDNSIDGVLYDPPYSNRQISESYKGVGLLPGKNTQSSYHTNHRKEIQRIVRPGGVVISFGWNSVGMGKKYGFKQKRILLVSHGGSKNDTICTVEIKTRGHSGEGVHNRRGRTKLEAFA